MNENLMLLILVIIMFINGIAKVFVGSMKIEKDTKYGNGDIFFGLIYIILSLIIYLT